MFRNQFLKRDQYTIIAVFSVITFYVWRHGLRKVGRARQIETYFSTQSETTNTDFLYRVPGYLFKISA